MRTILICAAALAVGALAWGGQQPAATSGKKATPVRKAGPGSGQKKATVATHKAVHGATTGVNKAVAGTSTAVHKTVSVARTTASVARNGASSVAGTARKSRRTTVRATTWRNRQAAPTPERYREIQRALVAKGYLPPEAASGTWDQASADALRKFQSEQNLDSNGKINSLSLIALGLGPRRDTPATKPLDASPGGFDH